MSGEQAFRSVWAEIGLPAKSEQNMVVIKMDQRDDVTSFKPRVKMQQTAITHTETVVQTLLLIFPELNLCT